MSLNNRFGLNLDLTAAEALARADTLDYRGPSSAPLPSENPLFAFSDASHLPLYDFPPDDRADPGPQNEHISASQVRMRFRDSAILRTEQLPGFSTGPPAALTPLPQPLTPAAYAPFSPSDEEGHSADDAQDAADTFSAAASVEDHEEDIDADEVPGEDFVRLNYFVHNGYRYDGDIFELRPPQERSIGSRPERVLEHKPAVLMHRQVFNRVYSEGTYNNRPSSLRQMRLSARLSTSSWASVSDMVAETVAMDAAAARAEREALLVVSSPARDCATASSPTDVMATPERARKHISLLVEHALVTEEQAQNIQIASRKQGATVVRAPRLVQHIAVESENVDPAAVAEKKNSKKPGSKTVKKGSRDAGKSSGSLKRIALSRNALAEKTALQVEYPGRRDAKDTRSQSSRKASKSPKRRPFWKSLVSSS